MSDSDEKRPDGISVRLRDVRTVHIQALAWGKDDEPPEWARNDESGRLKLVGLNERSLAVQLSVTLIRGLDGIGITIQGLYEVDQNSTGLLPQERDVLDEGGETILARIPEEFRGQLAERAGEDLFPFLRQAFATISMQLNPASPILLSPAGEWDVLTTA